MSEIDILYARILDEYLLSIPERIGAYVITHTEDNLHAERYVGSTKNLFHRMYGHYNKKIICIDLYITDDIILAESLERILMKLIKPATNIQIPSLSDKDKEIMSELLRDTDIKECACDNIVKTGCRYLKYIDYYGKRKPKIRTIGVINKEHDTRYVTLPKYWGEIGKKVLIHTISDKELKLELVE